MSPYLACVINSFESSIHCADKGDGSVTAFGSEGEGPGEFNALTGIEHGPGGQVSAMDSGRRRLVSFSSDGTLVSETALPADFQTQQLNGDRLFGFKLVISDSFVPNFVPMATDAHSGEIVWERADLAEAAGRECLNGANGVIAPGGGLVGQECGHELAFFDSQDAPSATVMVSPSYSEALPNERDVSAHVEMVSRIGLPMSDAQKEAEAAELRQKPKEWILKPISFRFDGQSRLWVATTRDRDAFSYFDVWADSRYFGHVRVRDRLLGFDVLGSTLVTLVERAAGERAIDWYDLAGL